MITRYTHKTRKFYGLFGLFACKDEVYLVLIKDRERVGHILGADIFRVTELEFLAFSGREGLHTQEIEMIQTVQR